jgi:hypothetical protein
VIAGTIAAVIEGFRQLWHAALRRRADAGDAQGEAARAAGRSAASEGRRTGLAHTLGIGAQQFAPSLQQEEPRNTDLFPDPQRGLAFAEKCIAVIAAGCGGGLCHPLRNFAAAPDLAGRLCGMPPHAAEAAVNDMDH